MYDRIRHSPRAMDIPKSSDLEQPGSRHGAQRSAPGGSVLQVAEQGTSGAGEKLPYLDRIQASFGHHDVSGIKAHIGGWASLAARQLGASAYAVGDRVAFDGMPDLRTAAHEAAHTIQQAGGVQLSGGVGKPGDHYERHADAVANAVVRGESAQGLLDSVKGRPGAATPTKAVQRDEPNKPGSGGPARLDPVVRQSLANQATSALLRLRSVEKLSPTVLAQIKAYIAKHYGAKAAEDAMKATLPLYAEHLTVDGADAAERDVYGAAGVADKDLLDSQLPGARFLDINGSGKIDAGDVALVPDEKGKLRRVMVTPELVQQMSTQRSVVNAAKELASAKPRFGHTKLNPSFWSEVEVPVANGGQGNDKVTKFQVKPGVKPSDAVIDAAKNASENTMECATAVKLIQYKALLEQLGEDRFNVVCAGMMIGPGATEAPLAQLQSRRSPEPDPSKRPPTAPVPYAPRLKPGDIVYARNSDVSPAGRAGGWQGENAIYLGGNQYYGHPFGVTTEQEIIDRLTQQTNFGIPAEWIDEQYMLDPSKAPK